MRSLAIFLIIISFFLTVTASAAQRLSVQVGSFAVKQSAVNLAMKLNQRNFECRVDTSRRFKRVLCGNFITKTSANLAASKLIEIGHTLAFVLTVDERMIDSLPVLSGGLTSVAVAHSIAEQKAYVAVQVGTYSRLVNAESVVAALKKKNINCRIYPKNGFYRVVCGEFKKPREASDLKKLVVSYGYKDAFITAIPINKDEEPLKIAATVVVAPVDEAPAISEPEPPVEVASVVAVEPMPEPVVKSKPSQKRINGDVFGKEGGHFHPFFSATGFYTDNVYKTETSVKADFVSVLTGGLWFAAPGTKRYSLKGISGSIPGGKQQSSFMQESKRRYQVYLLYKIDAELYSKYNNADAVNHKAEGVLLYNLRGGHKLKVTDLFLRSHDSKGDNPTEDIGEFTSNRFDVALHLKASEGLGFRGAFAKYTISYDNSTNDYKDHDDDAFSGFVFFKVMPKTSVFLQYTNTLIVYDNSPTKDSTQTDYLLGIDWNITGKTKGSLKAGYSTRDFDSPTRDDAEDFMFIGEIDYNFSPKTSVTLDVSRVRTEAGVSTADYVTSNNISLSLSNKMTAKIRGTLGASYGQSEYQDPAAVGAQRKDDTISTSLSVNYKATPWLSSYISYGFSQRDSNYSGNGFTSNTITLGVSASM